MERLRNFNSSVVRLRGDSAGAQQIILKFQFLGGAIKSFVHVLRLTALMYFNSSVVRLRVFKRIVIPASSNVFQFLGGAIKRSKDSFVLFRMCISIPRWCD